MKQVLEKVWIFLVGSWAHRVAQKPSGYFGPFKKKKDGGRK